MNDLLRNNVALQPIACRTGIVPIQNKNNVCVIGREECKPGVEVKLKMDVGLSFGGDLARG